ncbi:hypothetical protein [Paraburkholderia bannensis]|uniref:hypothetical protein n=1 Tax=Paraburkholderia bannensis TaxID=765414 RepID=UPI002AB125F7|nr:hypothetical protein [Paraburkholderia bannensis]
MVTPAVSFPRSVGTSTRIACADGLVAHVFMVDATVPLFNVVCGTLKFLASREQVESQVAGVTGGRMPAPDWEWVLDTGFDSSVDGAASKQWRMKPVGAGKV